MKANELMIGDWVLLDMNWAEDDPMYARLNYQPYQIKRGEDFDLAEETNCIGDADAYQPIPLTKEILEKNGFELREGCTTAWDWLDGEKSVHISGDHTCPIGQTVTIYTPGGCAGAAFSSHRTLSDHKIRGVHELQHALRLCGIEKEIEL